MRLLPVFVVVVGSLSTTRAQDGTTLDKAISDGLREVHDRGADLYNSGDMPGGYRMYQGGLTIARAALGHRPDVQKRITDGMLAADKQPSVARRAFQLHELIEQVRTDLRTPVKTAGDPAKKSATDPTPKSEGEPLPVPPREVKPGTPSPPDPKPDVKLPPVPAVKPDPKPPAAVGEVKDGLIGRVLWMSKPVAGVEVTFVTLGKPEPRVYETTSGAQGVYTVADLPAGKYVVLIRPGPKAEVTKLPERYATSTTSPLIIEVTGAGEKLDFVLQ